MKSKNVIITGTSRGIGFEMVHKFAEMGHRVLALSRNAQPIANLDFDNIHSLSFDLGLDDDYIKLKKFIETQWKRVDILINNAGFLVNKPFEETTLEDFSKTYGTNVFGVARMIQTVLPYMKTGSHVVNISSMGGVQGSIKFPGLAAYSSSKGAVITLTELLAEEYKGKGVAFNVLALGAVQTEMLATAFPGYKAPTTAREMAEYITNFALNGNTYYNGKILQVSSSTP